MIIKVGHKIESFKMIIEKLHWKTSSWKVIEDNYVRVPVKFPLDDLMLTIN